MSLNDLKIGWIGAGKMGGPMSRNLVAAGAEVIVFDPVAANVEAVVAGGRTGRSIQSGSGTEGRHRCLDDSQ